MTRNFQLAIVASDEVIAAARRVGLGHSRSFALSDRMSFAAVMGGLGCGGALQQSGRLFSPGLEVKWKHDAEYFADHLHTGIHWLWTRDLRRCR